MKRMLLHQRKQPNLSETLTVEDERTRQMRYESRETALYQTVPRDIGGCRKLTMYCGLLIIYHDILIIYKIGRAHV